MDALLRQHELHYRMVISALLATQRAEHPALIPEGGPPGRGRAS